MLSTNQKISYKIPIAFLIHGFVINLQAASTVFLIVVLRIDIAVGCSIKKTMSLFNERVWHHWRAVLFQTDIFGQLLLCKKELVLVRTISIRGTKNVWLGALLKPSAFEAGVVSIKKNYTTYNYSGYCRDVFSCSSNPLEVVTRRRRFLIIDVVIHHS